MSTWTPAQYLDRAVQAHLGLVALSLPPEGRRSVLGPMYSDTVDFIANILETSKGISVTEQEELLGHRILAAKETFFQLLPTALERLPFLRGDAERAWTLFVDRFDMRTLQLRVNLKDLFECFDVGLTSKVLRRSPTSLNNLPVSTELRIGPSSRGILMDLVIPPRLLLLDCCLMVLHATRLNAVMVNADTVAGWMRARLDTYCRQSLILSVAAVESVLSQYAQVIEHLGRSEHERTALQNFMRAGASRRIETVAEVWSPVTGNAPHESHELVRNDLLCLVRLRNRVIHSDARPTHWLAFELNFPALASDMSERAIAFLRTESHGVPGSHVGHELSLAEFALATAADAIDCLHWLLHGVNAPWVDLPRMASGRVDLDELSSTEPLLTSLDGGS